MVDKREGKRIQWTAPGGQVFTATVVSVARWDDIRVEFRVVDCNPAPQQSLFVYCSPTLWQFVPLFGGCRDMLVISGDGEPLSDLEEYR